MISFSRKASKKLHRLLVQWAEDNSVFQATFANGSKRDIALSTISYGAEASYAEIWARDFCEEKGEPVGEPYLIDLSCTSPDAKHVMDLKMY